jgi:hypothetical protein
VVLICVNNQWPVYFGRAGILLKPINICHVTTGFHCRGPSSIPGQFMWDVWWTNWRWHMFFSVYLGCPLSVSFHQCFILNHWHYMILAVDSIVKWRTFKKRTVNWVSAHANISWRFAAILSRMVPSCGVGGGLGIGLDVLMRPFDSESR